MTEYRPVAVSPESGGWLIRGSCGILLERPDGGPVALPGGGPLGPRLPLKERAQLLGLDGLTALLPPPVSRGRELP